MIRALNGMVRVGETHGHGIHGPSQDEIRISHQSILTHFCLFPHKMLALPMQDPFSRKQSWSSLRLCCPQASRAVFLQVPPSQPLPPAMTNNWDAKEAGPKPGMNAREWSHLLCSDFPRCFQEWLCERKRSLKCHIRWDKFKQITALLINGHVAGNSLAEIPV